MCGQKEKVGCSPVHVEVMGQLQLAPKEGEQICVDMGGRPTPLGKKRSRPRGEGVGEVESGADT